VHNKNGVRVVAALVAAMAIGAVAAPPAFAQGLQIHVLSTRANLVAEAHALTSIDLPAGTDPAAVTVRLNGSDVTSQFAERANGQFEGLLSGLVNGSDTVTATLTDGTSASTTIIDHPIGGPIFAGPQVQPWVCRTGATDAPTTYAYYYYMPAVDQSQVNR
jgi:Tannase-like family of unknown function (DUF6351)